VSARDDVLARIRAAHADHPAQVEVPRDYRQAGEAPDDEAVLAVLALLIDRLIDYKATVLEATPATAAAVIAQAIAERGCRRLAVPEGFPTSHLSGLAGVELVHDTPDLPLTTAALDTTDGVLTLSRLAVAETGTIVLDAGPGQGRRALTLVPDYHLCLVDAATVVRGVPEAIAELGTTDPTHPLTWISGPSATSDIELQRVEGVHGPRTLVVVLVSPA
jgi:L-lactate dehydrogenase complex protein LldG